ncbi:TetR/AcrR family transcriptional regulator [Nocardia thraciensis]
MPKVVDPEQRRRLVADAVFRVVRRGGIEAASLRNIAEEAGLAIGSVRHYFDGHDELLVFAIREMVDRLTGRVLAHAEALGQLASGEERVRRTETLLAEFLPLDEQRFGEAVVWLEFATAARTRPHLQPHSQRLHHSIRALIGTILARAEASGRLRPGLDLAIETERLRAVLDGLAIAGVLNPEAIPPTVASTVLHTHLMSLLADEPETDGRG